MESVAEMLTDELAAETVNSQQRDNVLQQNINAEQQARINADALKVDKPTADGTWLLKKAGSVFSWIAGVVDNIATADLSNISARIFTQGNTFTWNTGGFGYYLKGLVDKTGQSAYSKVVVVHPTTGEKVTRDFADPHATTLAVQSASAAQKTAMRTALLGTATPASPTISGLSRTFIKHNEDTQIILYGLNLTLLEPSYIYIELPDTTRVYATNFYNISNNNVGTTWNIPLGTPVGEYFIKIQNGVAVQGFSAAKIKVIDSYTIVNHEVSELLKNPDATDVNFSKNYISFKQGIHASRKVKGKNVFSGNLSAEWEIEINYNSIGVNSLNFNTVPFVGITNTNDSDFNSGILNTPYQAYILGNMRWLRNISDNSNTLTIQNSSFKLKITKPIGNIVFFTLSKGDTFFYTQSIQIDNSDYAFFIQTQGGGMTTFSVDVDITALKVN